MKCGDVDTSKKNCWEVMKCGREPGGRYEKHFGPCPATTAASYNGVHGGMNGGRACWSLAGTMSNRKPEGTYVEKYLDCSKCKFYKRVKKEEGKNFIPLECKTKDKAA